jgi:hypothetical protein
MKSKNDRQVIDGSGNQQVTIETDALPRNKIRKSRWLYCLQKQTDTIDVPRLAA